MQEMFKAAAILSAASLFAKILSAVYRVPYQNLVGDEGFYVYQQVYPFYGIAMTLSLTAIPMFLSKVLQETDVPYRQNQVLKKIFPLIFWLSVVAFIGLFLGANWIARAMGDVELAPLIKVVAFMYLLTPPLSFLRGNFQGIPWMTPTALSQMVEQFVRVAVIIAAAVAFQTLSISVYQTGLLAFCGGLVGGIVAFILLYRENLRMTLFRLQFKKEWFILKIDREFKRLLKRLLVEGGLVFTYSGLLLLYQLVDSFVVKEALQKGGLSDTAAKIAKGIFDRGQPLVQLGLVVALALSSTFLPMLTRQLLKKGRHAFNNYALMYLRLTTTLAAAATVGLLLLLPLINYSLFEDNQGEQALSLFVTTVFFVAVIQAFENILQSQNKFKPALVAALLGMLVKIALTDVLVSRLGTLGASLSTVLGLLLTLFYLQLHTEQKIARFYTRLGFLKKLALTLGGMAALLFIFRLIFSPLYAQSRLLTLLFALVGVILGVTWFLFSSVRLNLFTTREWLLLPGGKRLLLLFKKNN